MPEDHLSSAPWLPDLFTFRYRNRFEWEVLTPIRYCGSEHPIRVYVEQRPEGWTLHDAGETIALLKGLGCTLTHVRQARLRRLVKLQRLVLYDPEIATLMCRATRREEVSTAMLRVAEQASLVYAVMIMQ